MPTRLRPSAALIIAGLSLFVAIGGTAYATAKISGKQIVNHSISGKKLITNTLGGTQINESRLGTVPRAHAAGKADTATNADTVGHLTVRKIFYAPKALSSTPTTVLSLGGLVIKASCAEVNGGGALDVNAFSAVDHAHFTSQMWNAAQFGSAYGQHFPDFGPNSATRLLNLSDGNPWGETSFTYARANGIIVNGQVSFDSTDLNTANPGDNDIFDHTAKCLFTGVVISTTAAKQ